jgi:dihydroxyacetone kinase
MSLGMSMGSLTNIAAIRQVAPIAGVMMAIKNLTAAVLQAAMDLPVETKTGWMQTLDVIHQQVPVARNAIQ